MSHGEKLGLGLVNKELLNFTQKKFWVIESRIGGSGLHKELKQIRELYNCRSLTLSFIYLFILFTRVVILEIPKTPGPLSFIYLFYSLLLLI